MSGAPPVVPPVLLDLSRLISRADNRTPTGMDRIELAYAEHLVERLGPRLGFVAMNPAGDIAPVRDRYARLLVDTLGHCWRDTQPGARTARRIGMLTHVSGLVPGRSLRPRGAGAEERAVFLSLSHQNLHRRGKFAQLKTRSGAAFVFYVHDLIPIDYPEYVRPGHDARHAERMATVCTLADGVIVNSRATAESLAPLLRRAGREVPVLVAFPGAEFAQQEPGASKWGMSKLGASKLGRAPYFVCLGTVEPRKNHLLLLNVWRRLAGDADPPRLVIVGRRGWENENAVDMIERCAGIRPLVEEHGAMPDSVLRPLLAGACALLCPTFAEGYGMPVAEALAQGVPVLCSDIPAHHEAGGAAPEFLDPLDGLGWMAAIRDYAAPGSVRRAAQLGRIRDWRAPGWGTHFDAVAALLERVAAPRG